MMSHDDFMCAFASSKPCEQMLARASAINTEHWVVLRFGFGLAKYDQSAAIAQRRDRSGIR